MSFVRESLEAPQVTWQPRSRPVVDNVRAATTPGHAVIAGGGFRGSAANVSSERPWGGRWWIGAATIVLDSFRRMRDGSVSVAIKPKQRAYDVPRHQFLEHSRLERELDRRF